MKIAFTGPHGIGKTTNAKALAEQLGLEFVSSNAAEIAKKLDFKIDRENSYDDIYKYQCEILLSYWDQIKKDNIVLDRSPLDFIVYLKMHLANIADKVPPMELANTFLTYCEATYLVITKLTHIVSFDLSNETLLAPYENKPGRPISNKSNIERVFFQGHIKEFLHELLDQVNEDNIKHICVPMGLDYQDRVDFIKGNL